MDTIADEDIPNLKVGDIIYECQYGMNIEARVTSEPVEQAGFEGRRQWKWAAVNTQNGDPINYVLTECLSRYGPRLYRKPQYCLFKKGGEISFPLLGAAS